MNKVVNLKTGAVISSKYYDKHNISYKPMYGSDAVMLIMGIAKLHQNGGWTFRKFNPIVIVLNTLILLTITPAHLFFGGFSQAKEFLISFLGTYRSKVPKVSYLKTLKYIAIVKEYDRCS